MAAAIGTDCTLYYSDGGIVNGATLNTASNTCWPESYEYWTDNAAGVTRKVKCDIWMDYPETTTTGGSYKTYGNSSWPNFRVYKTKHQNGYGFEYCNDTYATTTTPVVWGNTSYQFHKIKSPQEMLKEIIQSRQAPHIRRNRHFMPIPADAREIRARETLRRVIGDEKYRGFLSKGFVSVRNPKSGRIYQIFPGHGITRVYENGQMIERLCVVLRGDFPPTDSVIVRYLMALNNEADLWKLAIKHGPLKKDRAAELENNRSLIEIYRELKVAA